MTTFYKRDFDSMRHEEKKKNEFWGRSTPREVLAVFGHKQTRKILGWQRGFVTSEWKAE